MVIEEEIEEDDFEDQGEYFSAQVTVYPNPTAGILEISGISQGDKIVQLYDNAGVLCFDQTIEGNTFNISELTPGLYHLVIIVGKDQYQLRVIKK